MKVIFILGSGHCGSTLLDLLLDSHSKMFGVGELTSVDKQKPTDIFWRDVLPPHGHVPIDVYRSKLQFLLNSPQYRSVHTRKCIDNGSYILFHEQLYQKILDKTGSIAIVDSSKNPDRVELLLRSTVIQPLIVHLVRDGRAVTWSYLRKYPTKIFFSFFKWFFANLKVEVLLRRTNVPHVFLHYNDIVRDAERALKKVLGAAGFSYEPHMLDVRAHPHHELGGNRMKEGTERKIISDDAWRHKMPRTYLALFLVLFGWMNLYYVRKK